MGKKYYCDYCDKSMVATPAIIKTHNKGLEHQKLVHEHYQEYKDPETIILEESKKIQCTRFMSGNCSFGPICRYSHYTKEELDNLNLQVQQQKRKKTKQPEPSLENLYEQLQNEKSNDLTVQSETLIVDANGRTHFLPWVYNPKFDMFKLPPSLERFTPENMYCPPTHWG
ncbi:zinc finger matrin-type protein 5 [Bombyx mori]|uniref:C3H1-type domain-containing protein n=1 Tax=Bombyx mori TaxID=7091 RepID=A0A8R2M6G1_BOMMO|nr:zinc finger matrin-type protein 5 [Bombyx mori]XP_037875834.1 zinc finger matrin-type protein 5 [Bombyx mori]XP_037875835.1 zinc finger matrin-type protein 5 [Bombyx mori]